MCFSFEFLKNDTNKILMGIFLVSILILSSISCGYSLYNSNPYFFVVSIIWVGISFLDFMLLCYLSLPESNYHVNFAVGYFMTTIVSIMTIICSFRVLTYAPINKYVMIWTFILISISISMVIFTFIYLSIYLFNCSKKEKETEAFLL